MPEDTGGQSCRAFAAPEFFPTALECFSMTTGASEETVILKSRGKFKKKKKPKMVLLRTSLMVQWLRLHAPN